MQAPKAARSSLHWKVPPSLPTKVKSAALLLVKAGGAVWIVVPGAVRSTTHVKLAGVPGLPAWSTARTSKVWLPAARGPG